MLGLVSALWSGSIFAVNLSTGSGISRYAEVTLNSAATTAGVNANAGTSYFNLIDDAGNGLDLTGTLGIEAGFVLSGNAVYVRFDLTNAAFTTALASNALSATTIGSSDNILQGGGAGESFVIFRITTAANGSATDTFTLGLTGVGVTGTAAAEAAFSTYSTISEAINQVNSLSGSSSTYVEFVDAITITTAPSDQVAESAEQFLSYIATTRITNATGTVASLGSIAVSSARVAVTNEIFDQLGTTHVIADSINASATTITISGNFTTGTYYLDTTVACPLSDNPPTTAATGMLTIAADSMSATQTLNVLDTNAWLCHVVDGVSEIPESDYTVNIAYAPASGSSTHAAGQAAWGSVTHEASSTDTDGDGVPDDEDDFPQNAAESKDTDGDEIGNNEDDNDGLPDEFETANGLDPLDDTDAAEDADGDNISNLVEFQQGTDLNDPNDGGDACLIGSGRDESTSALPIETRVYVANPASNSSQQTFLRFVNPNASATSVEVYGIDDEGRRSGDGPFSFSLPAQSSKQINASDIEDGNTDKGLTSSLCNGNGKWQFRIRSDNTIKVMGLIRTPDGFLTSLNDVAPESSNTHFVYFVNPASNTNQQTFLRFVNLSSADVAVTITGIDDAGVTAATDLSLALGANESKQLTAQDLEQGNAAKGLTGALGDGTGKWRLNVFSSLALKVVSMIRTPSGFLTNLSGTVDANLTDERIVYFANPASETTKTTFLRIINTSDQAGTVTIAGIDENGNIAPSGDAMLSIGANESKQLTADDLESGNLDKNLVGMLGDGVGRWRLTISADVEFQAMSLIRTPDGFLTNLSRTTPVSASVNSVYMFNPGSNISQRSSLWIVNNSDQQGSVTISGRDDNGASAPGGTVTFNIAANASKLITAQDLESGNSLIGLVGSLGNGTGKWHLEITSDVDLQVQSLLDTPNGFLTNLSQISE